MANDDEHCYLFSQSTLKLVVLLGAQKNHLNEMVLWVLTTYVLVEK